MGEEQVTMKDTNALNYSPLGLIGCNDCAKKGSFKRQWLTFEETFDLSVSRLASRHQVTYDNEQICSHCRGTGFYCFEAKGIELKGKISLSEFQRRAAESLDIDEHIDREALLFLMRHERLTVFAEALDQYKSRYFGTWCEDEDFVKVYLKKTRPLDKIPKEFLSCLDAEKYVDMLIDNRKIVYRQEGRKIWVFWP